MGLYKVLVSVLPAVNDYQLSPSVEKQHIARFSGTDSKVYFSHLNEGTPTRICIFLSVRYIFHSFGTLLSDKSVLCHNISSTAPHLYSILQVQLWLPHCDTLQLSGLCWTFSGCLTALESTRNIQNIAYIWKGMYLLRWAVFLVRVSQQSAIQYSPSLPALHAASPLRGRADSHLLQVIHPIQLWIKRI